MDNQYTPEQSNTDNNIDSLIQELHDELSEKDAPQNVPKELRESEYSDAFDEYLDAQEFDELVGEDED